MIKIDFACKTISVEELLVCSFNLNKTDLKILKFFLKYNKSVTVKELSSFVKLERSGVQKSIIHLVEKGLVERRQINNERGGFFYRYSLKDKEELKNTILSLLENWCSKAKRTIERL